MEDEEQGIRVDLSEGGFLVFFSVLSRNFGISKVFSYRKIPKFRENTEKHSPLRSTLRHSMISRQESWAGGVQHIGGGSMTSRHNSWRGDKEAGGERGEGEERSGAGGDFFGVNWCQMTISSERKRESKTLGTRQNKQTCTRIYKEWGWSNTRLHVQLCTPTVACSMGTC